MRNALFGGKEGIVGCFSELKRAVSYKLFFLKKISKQNICSVFWASVLEGFFLDYLFLKKNTQNIF